MASEITLRNAIPADLPEMKELYKGTIMQVCADDYDEAQRNIWASSANNIQRWEGLISSQYVLLAVKDGIITGFGSLRDGNYLDFMYVHKEYQRQGIADVLLHALEAEAIGAKSAIITSDVSKTARPFFEKKGYVVVKEQENVRENVILINYKMKKEL